MRPANKSDARLGGADGSGSEDGNRMPAAPGTNDSDTKPNTPGDRM
jgi:hypothetical protein